MPRDEGTFCAASSQEIIAKHVLQVQQRILRTEAFLRLKAAHSFEAFDVMVPLEELHSTVLPYRFSLNPRWNLLWRPALRTDAFLLVTGIIERNKVTWQ
jgi:hypothetical protein